MDQPLDAELLDLTKENIQPLKHGRRADQLFTALHAELDTNAQKKLDEQREQFELAIRMYEGDDPLEPRYQFAHWIEQSYLKLGPNSKLLPLLEDTINLYKDDKRYRQDERFIEMLVKFIKSQSNPIELYQLAYNQGLGTMCSVLYGAWAEELDEQNDWRRANHVYEMGIANRAQPLEPLKRAHAHFQLSVGRRMMNGEEGQGEEREEEGAGVVPPPRQAFSKLKRAQVKGSTRQPQGLPGVLRAQSQSLQPFTNTNRQAMPITIYQENSEENFMGGSSRAQMDLFPKTAVLNKENSLKAGPWKGSHSSKHSRASSHTVAPPSTPSFHVHEDVQEKKVNYQTPIVPRALKSIRAADIACPVAIFEAPDPSKQVMYAKHKVYVGGREFQLEELRAAIYNKRYAIQTGQTHMCEFQTPMTHFGKTPFGGASCRTKAAASISTPLLAAPSASTPHHLAPPTPTESKACPVRLFADASDNSDVDDDTDAQCIKFYRNDKNVLADDTVLCDREGESDNALAAVCERESCELDTMHCANDNAKSILESTDKAIKGFKSNYCDNNPQEPFDLPDQEKVPQFNHCDNNLQEPVNVPDQDKLPQFNHCVTKNKPEGFMEHLDVPICEGDEKLVKSLDKVNKNNNKFHVFMDGDSKPLGVPNPRVEKRCAVNLDKMKKNNNFEVFMDEGTKSFGASNSNVDVVDLDKMNITVKSEFRVDKEKDVTLMKKKTTSQVSEQKLDRPKLLKKKTKPSSGLAFSIFTE